MKSVLSIAFALFVGTAAFAGQHPISFSQSFGFVPPFSAPENSPVAMANEAFTAKYGAETGVLGTAVGTRGQLLVLVSNMRFATQIWRKMLGAGDAFSATNGIGYFRYQSFNEPGPSTGFVFGGKINISEGGTGYLTLANGTPEIKGFLVGMDNKCIMGRAAVVAVGGLPIEPTRLVRSYQQGSYTMVYEYSVNGGMGALLSQIVVSLGTKHPLGFITDICPIEVDVKY